MTALRGALAAESVRLVRSLSTWWCLGTATALALGSAVLAARVPEEGRPVTVLDAVAGLTFGEMILIVLAALSVTGEYRHGTIRVAFLAVPERRIVIAAKALLMAVIGAAIAICLALASLGVAALAVSGSRHSLAPDTAAEWRQILGMGIVWAFAAVAGVAVGGVVRNGAAAVSVVLLWSLLVESAVGVLPRVGGAVAGWMPFTAVGGIVDPETDSRVPLGAVGGTGYAIVVGLGLLSLAMLVTRRQDL
ncbi:ABC transporter permease [Actinomadura chibensis]|uniref:ABC transporter permease n=1 Tax=Actinomadura chibensis TaxID=392828 RepID=A0A5D0NSU5_9ACTN|nr:ABC transporter permease [Actinomadura chibensis]TYB47770.1 ABC transporter permease [Actinomadura chibensis]